MMAATWQVPDVNPIPALRLVTPAAPIVTWSEAAAFLRIDGTTEQTLIESFIAAATQHLDAKYGTLAGTTLGVQTQEMYLDAFPCGPIKIPLSPFVDVSSITYFDSDGLQQTLDPASYEIDNKSYDGWVVPLGSWPATLASINVVTVRFRAGFGTIPAPLKLAVLLLTGHFYEHREAVSANVSAEISIGVDRLVAPYRRVHV
jgi:uncharacterized phiE125 gp8 family phage protein